MLNAASIQLEGSKTYCHVIPTRLRKLAPAATSVYLAKALHPRVGGRGGGGTKRGRALMGGLWPLEPRAATGPPIMHVHMHVMAVPAITLHMHMYA